MEDEHIANHSVFVDANSRLVLNRPSPVKPASLQQTGTQCAKPPSSDEPGRPSLESFPSSSSSTGLPPTPSRLMVHLDTRTTVPDHLLDANTKDEESGRRKTQVYVVRDTLSPPENELPSNNISSRPSTGESTLRRFGRRKLRPSLGVATFDAATNNIIDASPLSPVVASPRSIQHQTTSTVPMHDASNDAKRKLNLPLASPDVSLDFATGADSRCSAVQDDTIMRFSNPFRTPHISRNVDQPFKTVSDHCEETVQLQYKPRKRVPTPRRLSFDRRESPSSTVYPSFRRHRVEQVQPEETFGSLRRNSTLSSAKSKGISTLRRLSALWSPQSSSGHQHSPLVAGGSFSAVEPHVSLTSVSDGDHMLKRSSIGRRLSNILPFSRRISSPHDDATWDAKVDENDIHTTIMIQGHTSRPQPPPFASSGIPANIQRNTAPRLSTVTIRSSDGWYSTIPIDEVQHLQLNSINHATTSHAPNTSRTSLQQPTPITRMSNTNLSHDGHEDSNQAFISLSMPPSPVAMNLPCQDSRPHSLQNHSLSRIDCLNGTTDQDGSVRLLDARDAAALRRSIDFDDRVRKSENVLRRALYGSDNVTSRSSTNISTSFVRSGNRSRSVSSGRSTGHFYNGHRIRPGDTSKSSNSVGNGGGVFLSRAMSSSPSTTRPSPLRSNSTPGDIAECDLHMQALSPPSEDSVGVNAPVKGLIEDPGQVGRTRLDSPVAELNQSSQSPRYPKFARRLGRRISHIFVGNE